MDIITKPTNKIDINRSVSIHLTVPLSKSHSRQLTPDQQSRNTNGMHRRDDVHRDLNALFETGLTHIENNPTDVVQYKNQDEPVVEMCTKRNEKVLNVTC
jgi:hypothetical protein